MDIFMTRLNMIIEGLEQVHGVGEEGKGSIKADECQGEQLAGGGEGEEQG